MTTEYTIPLDGVGFKQIELDLAGGVHIEDVATRAADLALNLNCVVSFKHNGTLLIVYPYMNREFILQAWKYHQEFPEAHFLG